MGRLLSALRPLAEAVIVLGAGMFWIALTWHWLPSSVVLVGSVVAGAGALAGSRAFGALADSRRSRRFWRAVADQGVTPDPSAPSNPHILHPDGTRTPLAITEDPERCSAGHRCYLITMPDGSPIQAADDDLVGMEQPFDFHVTYLTPEGPREIEGGRDA